MAKYLRYFKDENSYEEAVLSRPSISFIENLEQVHIEDFSARFNNRNELINFEDLSNTDLFSYFCEDDNKMPLEDFSEMTYSELSTFIQENHLPFAVKHVGIYDKDNNRYGEIDCSRMNRSFDERLYRFGLLSDVHNQSNKTAEPDEDLQRALELFNNKESINFTCICGDISENGTESEFQDYLINISLKSPDTPVYTCTGNHDSQNAGLDDALWKTYTGCDKNFVISQGNDKFIFLSMSQWSLGTSGTPYSTESIEWLKDQLNLFRENRVFIFTHLFFPNLAGNFKERYPSGNWLGGEQLKMMKQLRQHFTNTIWFGGHSHWKWYLQQYEDNANIDKDGGWTVHIPSCASPIDSITTDGGVSWSRDSKPLESEGAVVDVYENYIDIRGIDLKNNKYFPFASYRLNTTIIDSIPEFSGFQGVSYPNMNNVRYIKASDIQPNYEKPGSELIEVSEENDYIIIKFFDTSTGLFIKNNDEYFKDVTDVKLIVDSAEISYNGTHYSQDYPEKFGFYKKGGGYILESCEGVLDLNSNGNIQLNVSSSYSGELPIYIRLKFKLGYK